VTDTVPTKQRPGDQALPVADNPRPAVQDQIIAEMIESKRVGTERYGQPLKPMNGRDTLLDAREEARDLHVYLTALMAERAEILELARNVATDIDLGVRSGTAADMARVIAWLEGSPIT
jgi:hypothetical protein